MDYVHAGMSAFDFLHFAVGTAICAYLLLIAVSSARERRPRAVLASLGSLVVIGGIWFGLLLQPFIPSYVPVALTLLATAAAVLFFAPLGRTESLQIGTVTDRADERDVMFAREEYAAGTEKYRTYYAMRPENKDVDDRLRALPELLAPGGRYYDSVRSPAIDNLFGETEALLDDVDGDITNDMSPVDPAAATADVKHRLGQAGADDVGVAKLNPMYVYSHVGRGPEPWGTPIVNNHRFVIVFTLEMRYRQVESAPGLAITEESAIQYHRGARMSIALAEYIRSLGYPARAHVAGSNYQIMLPPVAHDAGLGELGRTGYLISPRFGARVRLGAVTTDLPLIPDEPITFGVRDFCNKCRKCAINCPSGAIPHGAVIAVRGVEKWPLNVERCLHYWRVIGTDCGLCMKVCPFSHPDTLVHRLVKEGVKRSSLARTVSVWGDDVLYGKRVRFERP